MTLTHPVVADYGDAFVVRDAGRRQTVAGGRVLDANPPARAHAWRSSALEARLDLSREELATQVIRERGALRLTEVPILAGGRVETSALPGMVRMGSWVASPTLVDRAGVLLRERLSAHHAASPLLPGLEVAEARTLLADAQPPLADPGLADAMIERLASAGLVARVGSWIKLPEHRVTTLGRDDADRLVETVEAAGTTPPTVKELGAQGFGPELIAAATVEGRLVRVSSDLVMTPAFVARAEETLRATGPTGIGVAAFREALGTSRKYAVPLLEYFDSVGLTRRTGDVRVLRAKRP